MQFPDKLDEVSLQVFLRDARVKRVNPIFTDGQVVVPRLGEATKVALFESGEVVAKYQLRGDGTWRKI